MLRMVALDVTLCQVVIKKILKYIHNDKQGDGFGLGKDLNIFTHHSKNGTDKLIFWKSYKKNTFLNNITAKLQHPM